MEKQVRLSRESQQRPQLSVSIAETESEIRAAKALRYQVFANELGARLDVREPGIDHDLYDPYCKHLIVRDDQAGIIVGTYRILSPLAARQVGSYYSESEFDLTRLQHLRPSLVEIGRSCVHPDYRTGATITLLWAGLARYMTSHGYTHLVGCASVTMADGGHIAASLYSQIEEKYMAPLEYRVFPRLPLPLESLRGDVEAEMPPLIRGYLRAGAWVCGAPAWDPDFNTADMPILLPMSRISPRFARHFLGGEQ